MRPRLVKLVRDRIGEFVGDSTVTYEPITDPEEGIAALRLKLVEEAVEYLRDPCIGELADVLAVVHALALLDVGCGWMAVEEEADAKAAERGGFLNLMGMYVQTTAPERHEAARTPTCAHVFVVNPGMYDTMHRYCEACGIAEPPKAGKK